MWFWDFLKDNNSTLIALFSLFISFCTFYFTILKKMLQKPNLTFAFPEDLKLPYIQVLGFGRFERLLEFDGRKIFISYPGLSVRLKVLNTGNLIAKNVYARVERIELREQEEIVKTWVYHPTTVKWSVERSFTPVDIAPKSHFFLDLIQVVNTTTNAICDYTNFKHPNLTKNPETLRKMISALEPSEEIYWNVWVDLSYDRGIEIKFYENGYYKIHFIIFGDNLSPIRFECYFDWNRINWSEPRIKIGQGYNWFTENGESYG